MRKIDECVCCGTEDVEGDGGYLKKEFQFVIDVPHTPDHYEFLCDICAGTFIANAYQYPDQYDKNLYQTIGQVANIILKAIQKKEAQHD